jgi:phosphatidylglycerophosphate synthase
MILSELLFKVVFPLILLASMIFILISGIFSRKIKEERESMLELDDFIKDWLKDHGQEHKLEEQFEQMKKDPAGAVYMPLTYNGAKFCIKIGLTPNKVSLINLILSFFIFWSTIMIAQGHTLSTFTQQPLYGIWFFLLGFIVLFTGYIDGVDGGMARILGTKSKKGAWFDNVIDKISDILMLVGLIPTQLLYISTYNLDFKWLVWTNLFLILIYEYMRARHEGLGLHETKPFIGERITRISLQSFFYIFYGSTSLGVLITNLIAPGTASALWSATHPGVIEWTMTIFQALLLIIMAISSIQLARYSYKSLKKLDDFTEE